MSLSRPRHFVGTIRATAAAQTVTGSAVNVLVLETTDCLAGLKPGEVHRIELRRATRRPVLPRPAGRACGLRQNRIHGRPTP